MVVLFEQCLRMLKSLSLVMIAVSFSLRADVIAASETPFLREGVEDIGWPSLRGPTYDGHSPEIRIANQWSDQGPPVLWTKELGQGYSALVAVDNRVFTQGQTLSGQYLLCLDADSGRTLWKHKIDWPCEGMGVYPGPRSTPTIDQGMVYFTAPNGLVGCLNASNGKSVWSKNVLSEYQGAGGDGFGYSCSPLVVDGMVILPVGGPSASLVALDQNTGHEVWSEGDLPASYASAMPVERNGRKLVVGYLQNSLAIHDRLTGKLLREVNLSQGYDEHSCWPIYAEPFLWTSAPFRSGSKLYRLPEDFDTDEALDVVWTSKTMSNDVLSSVLVDGHIYGFDIFDVQSKTQRPSRGMFRCIDFMTGDIKWSQGTGRPRRGGKNDDPDEIGQSGIIAADGKLLLLNERGELILLAANSERMQVISKVNVLGGELTWTPPTLHRGRIYIRNHSRAVCLYVGEPELLDLTHPTLTIAEIPQPRYRNLAAMLIPVEPEYMFDVPSTRWLWNWYVASLSMLSIAGVVGYLTGFAFSIPRQSFARLTIYRSLAFLGGMLGTTYLSVFWQEFYFTWPLCLYVTFEPVVLTVRKRTADAQSRAGKWQESMILLAAILTSVIYFYLCRRLSLVFEWAFLMGYFGAIPFLLIQINLKAHENSRIFVVPLLTILAFSGFYFCGILPLLLGY